MNQFTHKSCNYSQNSPIFFILMANGQSHWATTISQKPPFIMKYLALTQLKLLLHWFGNIHTFTINRKQRKCVYNFSQTNNIHCLNFDYLKQQQWPGGQKCQVNFKILLWNCYNEVTLHHNMNSFHTGLNGTNTLLIDLTKLLVLTRNIYIKNLP